MNKECREDRDIWRKLSQMTHMENGNILSQKKKNKTKKEKKKRIKKEDFVTASDCHPKDPG